MTKVCDPSVVQIGISTKNRWEDLHNTLLKLAEFGLGDLRTLILDDASDEPCPFAVSSVLRGAEIKRFSKSMGYIVRRNQLAREMDSKYYLSFDDDSFPVSGSLMAAVGFADSREDSFCLSFPIHNPVLGTPQVESLREEPYPVRSFIGCGHLLNRQRFLELGGYCEELVHQGEEIDVAARAFQRGLRCYHFPGLQVHHLASNNGRNWHRMDYFAARNSALWNDWFMPPELRIAKQGRTFIARVLQVVRTGRLGHVQGQLTGLREISNHKANRRPMRLSLYKKWKGLPVS